MTNTNKIHLLIISIINLGIILKLISLSWNGNDKAILLIMLVYPMLILMNGLIWLILNIIKKEQSEIYKKTTIGLLVLFIPTILISCIY
jgi:hypothetical protein